MARSPILAGTFALASLASLSSLGCAAVFRDQKTSVHVDSTPPGATIENRVRPLGTTPAEVTVDRGGATNLRVSKPGYADRWGAVGKHLNAGWVVADVATCVIPVALCIPLLVDAISGAWNDVDDVYHVTLEPAAPGAPPPVTSGAPPPGAPPPMGAPPAGSPPPPPPTARPGDISL